jgi:hypothetical protein
MYILKREVNGKCTVVIIFYSRGLQGGQLQVEIPASYSQRDIQYSSSNARIFAVNNKGACLFWGDKETKLRALVFYI